MVMDLQEASRTFADGIKSSEIRLFGSSSAPLQVQQRERRRAEPRNGGPMLGRADDDEYDDEDEDEGDLKDDDEYESDAELGNGGMAAGDSEDEVNGDGDVAYASDSDEELDLDLVSGFEQDGKRVNIDDTDYPDAGEDYSGEEDDEDSDGAVPRWKADLSLRAAEGFTSRMARRVDLMALIYNSTLSPEEIAAGKTTSSASAVLT